MTGKDRAAEIAALKRRLEELEAEASPTTGSNGPSEAAPVVTSVKNEKLIYAGAGVVVAGLIAVALLQPTKPAAPAVAEPAPPSVNPSPRCNMAWSREVVEKARQSPMIRSVAVRADGLHIRVSTARWDFFTQDQQDQVVTAFDCAIAGPGYLNRIVIENQSGVAIQTFSAVELYAARKLQRPG